MRRPDNVNARRIVALPQVERRIAKCISHIDIVDKAINTIKDKKKLKKLQAVRTKYMESLAVAMTEHATLARRIRPHVNPQT